MDIRELVADREIAGAYPLMRQLRDWLREETFLAEVRRQQVEGYRLFGLFDADRLCALAGVRYAKLGFQFLTSIPSWSDAGDFEGS